MKPTHLFLPLSVVLLSSCASLEPRSTEVAPAIPTQWPATTASAPAVDVADIGWRDYFLDPRLQSLIAQSLENNRDLRVAVLNVDKARAQYRIQRADRVPALGAQGQMTRTGGDAPVNEQFSANLGVV
jgi:multidrug efflux system outer membrane protein